MHSFFKLQITSCVCIAAIAYMGRYGNFGNKIGNLCSLGINAKAGKLYKMQITDPGNGSHSVRHKCTPGPFVLIHK